jgi:hypothetical protein
LLHTSKNTKSSLLGFLALRDFENKFGVKAANLLHKEVVGIVGKDSTIDEGASLVDKVSLDIFKVSF